MKVLGCLSAFFLLTPAVLAETTLLEFSAKWCPPCRDMEPVVAALEREGYHVERVNVDLPESKAKMRQFKVQNIPTFVFLTDGRETGRLVGAADAKGPIDAKRLRQMLGPVGVANAKSKPQPTTQSKPGEVSLASLAKSGKNADGELIRRSVRIVVDEPKGRSYGTGTVIQSVPGETLVLTCGHLFEGSARKGKTTVEFFGAVERVRLAGELVARDAEADLSIIRVTTNHVFSVAPIASKSFAPEPGQPASSVGCDNGKDPTARHMRITAVNRYLGAPTIECSGEPVEGRSGGGLFNDSGELIGVCSAREPSEHRGIYGGLVAVHTLLDRQGLASIYQRKTPDGSRVVTAGLNQKRDGTLTLPSPEELGIKVGGDVVAPAGIEDAEVVLVIRSVTDPKAPAKVVLLNRASPEFLSILEKEQAAQEPRTNTSMRLPNRPNLRPLGKEPANSDALSSTLDTAGWRTAGRSKAGSPGADSADGPHRSTIVEAAKWERDWPAGASSADGPIRR
jgi:thiol-disulfide isomerase/thioredoxin